MEKSMVQELSSLTHSTIFSSRPSFLFPSEPERAELRKSRIQNLPGYRREDLSGRLNFVVVFQTIEIERLTQQVQTLRIMARDWERQRLNYENYEVQIRELTERCHAYELQRAGSEEEAERVRQFCGRLVGQLEESRLQGRDLEPGLREKYQLERARNDQLQLEADRWRTRYCSLEASRARELEDLRNEFESRRRSQVSRQARELALRHENEVGGLSGELRKAREECAARGGEIARLSQLVGKFQLREEETREIEDKMYDYENKFVMLSQENYRLNELLRKKADEIDRVRRAQREAQARAQANSAREQQMRALQTELQTARQSLQEMTHSYSSLAQQNQALGLECGKVERYSQLMGELEGEVQRLHQLMRDRVGECDQLKTANRTLEGRLAGISTNTQKELANYQDTVVTLSKEQERLGAQLKHRLAENQELRVRCGELEKEVGRLRGLQEENESLRGELGHSSNRLEEAKRKIRLLEESLALTEEAERKLRRQEEARREVLADQERLNACIRELTGQLELSRQKVVRLQEEASAAGGAEEERREWRGRVGWMTQELDRLNCEIQGRVGEIQQLRENYRSLTTSKLNYQNIEQRLIQNLAQMEQLILDLDATRRENDRLQNDNMNMEVTIKGLQGQLITLIDERDDRLRVITAQKAEVQEMRQRVQEYSEQLQGKQQLEQALQEQNRKAEAMRGLTAQLQERLTKETEKNEFLALELMQVRSQPRLAKELIEEISLLRSQADEHNNTISHLLQRMGRMETLLGYVKQAYAASAQQAHHLRECITSLQSKSNCISGLAAVFAQYSEKMEALRQENLRLESEKALPGVEYCESMKVLHNNTLIPEKSIVKNSSIAFKVSAQDLALKEGERDLFTFKEMRQSGEEAISERAEEGQEEQEEGSSMASSFINTLITKESVRRFQPRESENIAFGYNANKQPHSPSALQYQTRYQREEFLPIETQIQNMPTQMNRAVSPSQRGSFFENAGIKRVTSYTHFLPTFQSHLSPSQDITPSIRVQEVHRSPSTVSSTNESCSQLGKRMRVPVDPARLLAYRQH